MEGKHYDAIDGLRMIACFGIVMMHVRASCSYDLSGFIYDKVISSFTNFVFLFMTVSSFGMCCGYYRKIINNQLSLSYFYGKRFKKILPFFGFLVLLDFILAPSVDALYEVFANLTLMFGFLPNAGNITVIGVGWFLGLIFVFYICFPFFCTLIENKRRAWIAFAISLIYNFVGFSYFNIERTNILYSGCFFLVGGLIYLYRNEIEKINRWVGLSVVAVSVILYYTVGGNVWMRLLVSTVLLIYAVICANSGISQKATLLQNNVTKFFSSISMEIYLSHMVIFRVIEKLGLNKAVGNGWVQYFVTVVLVLAGTTLFAVVMQRLIGVINNGIEAMVKR